MEYTVVENSGYDREKDVFSHTSYWEALSYRARHYTDSEIREMHVEIAIYLPDGTRTYEI